LSNPYKILGGKIAQSNQRAPSLVVTILPWL
jgi:hypothetical protein